MLNIAIFVGTLNGGGAERMMVNNANGFVELGHDVTMICASFEGPYVKELDDRVKVFDLQIPGVISSVFSLSKLLKEEMFDILLVTQDHTTLMAIVCFKLFRPKTKLVVREASTPSRTIRTTIKSKVIDILLRFLYRSADGFVALSDGARDDVSSYYNIPHSNLRVIHNPVIMSSLPALLSQQIVHPFLDPNRSHLALIAVGRVSVVKDYATMLKALSEVNKKREAKLLILGKYSETDPEFIKLKALISALGLAERVCFLGFRENPFAYLSRADIFVLSSLYEGMPGALVQAMACGCQCVSTDCKSGPSELLEGGTLGKLVPVGDSGALSKAILDIADNPVDANLLSAKSKSYNYIASSQSYIEYFNSLIIA